MKIQIDRDGLLPHLRLAMEVARERHGPGPITECVLIRTEGDHVWLEATDQKVRLVRRVSGATVMEPGRTLLPARACDVLQALGDALVTISGDPGECRIVAGPARVTLNCPDYRKFPGSGLTAAPATGFTIYPSTLCEMAAQTVFATAEERTRYRSDGVQLKVSPEELALAASDGRRLAISTRPLVSPPQAGPWAAVVPAATMRLLIRAFDKMSDLVTVTTEDDRIAFHCEQTRLTSDLIDFKFPDYQGRVPEKSDTRVTLNRHDLLDLLAPALALPSGSGFPEARFSCRGRHIKTTSLRLSEGRIDGVLTADCQGEPIDIGLNLQWLAEGLRAATDELITIEMAGSSKPVLVRGYVERSSFTYLQMPVRCDDSFQ